MTFSEFKFCVLADLYRLDGQVSKSKLLKEILFGEAFKFLFWFRVCNWSRSTITLKYTLYPVARIVFNHYTYKFGISIPIGTQIDAGFYIGHFGCIIVNPECKIGKNVNISHGVTLGQANRGERRGSPSIGDNVYIAPGAKIIGKIKIGNNVAIGANSVVTKDIEDNAVVVGIPGKVISSNGANDYVALTDYMDKIA